MSTHTTILLNLGCGFKKYPGYINVDSAPECAPDMVSGNYTLQVGGNIKINGSQVNINNGSKGAARVGDTADTGDDPPGVSGSDGTNKIETGSKTVFIGD